MDPWLAFWTVWLVIAAISFAVITAIVTVKGYRDLRSMFSRLAEQRARDRE